MNDKEKHLNKINELHARNQELHSRLERFSEITHEQECLGKNIAEKEEEIRRLNAEILDTSSKSSVREYDLDRQYQNQQVEMRGKQDIINHLNGVNKNLQENLTEALKRNESISSPSTETPSPDESDTPTDTRNDSTRSPNVTIFHDSLCHKINDTMMRREDIEITKVWAPTLEETQNKIDEIEPTDRIVIQGLTRHVPDMSPEDLTILASETVTKCLTKAEKVIICLIIDREDDPEYRAKAEVTNALIKLKFMNSTDVLICSNDNLRERRYKQKRDLLHLTVAGTSRLANNLKYCIAKSLDIEIVKKRNYNNYENNDRNDVNQLNFNRRSWNSGHDWNNEYTKNNHRNNLNQQRYQSFGAISQHPNNGRQQNGFTFI